MLRLRKYILSSLSPPSSTSNSLLFALHRLPALSATALPSPPNPSFAVEDYLVTACGLTHPQALKASKSLSHLKSPSNPDAVLAFLRGLGVSDAGITSLVAKDPKFLCTSVDRTLAPNVAELTDFGLSHSEIAQLVPVAPDGFRRRTICRNLGFGLPIFGSFDVLLAKIKCSARILMGNIEKTVKPNVELMRECGLTACDIAKLCSHLPRILVTDPEGLRAMIACAEGLGVPRGSTMFRHALHAIAFRFRWSDAQLSIAVCKHPTSLSISEEKLQAISEFLISEVGLEPKYIAHRPAMLSYGLDSRHRPRYYVLKFLGTNGLLKRDYYFAVMLNDKLFVDKFINPHKEAAPFLAQDYAAACRGDLPTRFRFE